jgi:chromosome partitioning protein
VPHSPPPEKLCFWLIWICNAIWSPTKPRITFVAASAAELPQILQNTTCDFVLLDCPPSLGEETAAALKMAQIALVPVAAEFPAVRGLARVMEVITAAKRLNRKLQTHLVVTMLDRRSDHGPTILAAVRAIPGVHTFEAVIPRSLHFAKAAAAGKSILAFSPKSPGTEAYQALASEITSLKL